MSFLSNLLKLHDRGDIKKRPLQRFIFWNKANFKMPSILRSKWIRSRQMISRIFLATIFICTSAFANQASEELDASLLERKKQLEPFDQSKIKIDLESLGLDDVDKKNSKEATEKNPPITNSVKNDDAEKPDKPLEKVSDDKNAKSIDDSNDEIAKKTQTKDGKEKEVGDSKKPKKKYINLQKKRNLEKRLKAENKRKESVKKQAEKLKKFQELRRRYLIENNENEIDDAINSEEKILPHKKDLNPFLNEEMPALPILNRYRTAENIHIPIILTVKERADLLFSMISSADVLAFNEAYKDVRNPNVKNALGDTILTYSLLLRRYPITASIIEKGADLNMPNKLGYTPLSIAIELLDFKSFEMLANNKADLNELDNFGRSYLMQASRVGFLSAVDFLVTHGADINLMDNDGFTALAVAYRHKQEVIVQYLLKHGAKTWIEKPYDPKSQSLIQELESRWK